MPTLLESIEKTCNARIEGITNQGVSDQWYPFNGMIEEDGFFTAYYSPPINRGNPHDNN